ncbi:monofunctional biosynthetic peptidoglycan transglycosylase [Oceanisphaera psychrotolerans]|uniref:Biosynthetic peptidoglycan transglycosylase n=1 Tax=Oceanisphaera psychrotolerans TaxID=1414654 RepID=A0A1J4QKG8_9GAMM|nr:monofunctional biosynthetic peptidoglycan transglycosylase [Oceanisphaera psychrotolerans]OIN13996.1 monofunctional biosynthetic peptidoglycan transglycosylase [Oceanisphaera psychrotolerans]
MLSFLKRCFRWLLGLLILAPLLLTLLYRYVPVPVTPLMVIRLFEGESLSKDWQPSSRLSGHLKMAVIAAEDNKFCRHRGFDWDAFADVFSEFRHQGRLRGGSTITMQTAKNLYLWPGRSVTRKVLEAIYTPMLELILPKDRILTLYLNIAEFGPGIYGAEAAANAYFNTSADRLTRHQAALLAAVLPNPRVYHASRPSTYVQRRATTIGQRMNQLGPLLGCVDR